MPDQNPGLGPIASSDNDLPETLYHYTDINGLVGIWEKGQIWATNSMYLNDTSEVRLGLSMVRSRLAHRELELFSSIDEGRSHQTAEVGGTSGAGSARERLSAESELAQIKQIRAALEASEEDSVTYVACLTEHWDQLSQWRGYSREGYCLGFDTRMILESLVDRNRVMRRVQYYDEADNDVLVSRMVDVAVGHRGVATQDLLDVAADRHRRFIAEVAVIEAAFLKHRSFREEAEVRIVEMSSEPDLFTPNQYGMVPRRTIPIPPGAIRSVRVGPSAHAELKRLSLVRYFDKVGFGGRALPWDGEHIRPAVYLSSIPFRDG